MAISSGEITLTTVNDGYTLLLTPDALTITAALDGSSPDLSNAVVGLNVALGSRQLPFRINSIETTPGVTISNYSTHIIYESFTFQILTIPREDLSGFVRITLTVDDGSNSVCSATLRYSVIRQAGMLDWIMDWEGTKTTIGSTYIMTPKVFIGRKDQVIEEVEVGGVVTSQLSSALTGVYIGPDEETSGLAPGIYGFLQGGEIFHLNSNGGNIGGWRIFNDGLFSPGGNLSILSSGSIEAKNNADLLWGVYENGNAVFAKGNIHFYANGDADFKGTITSSAGSIGGWTINDIQLYNKRVALDTANNCIGVVRNQMAVTDGRVDLKSAVNGGGVIMYYNNASDFGLVGNTSAEKVFQLGSTNRIGCWSFNNSALYSGTLNNATGQYTSASGHITIGSRGIRGYQWRIEDNGTAAFSGGLASFNVDSASFFGWNVVDKRFSTKHVALVSENSAINSSGLYISGGNLNNSDIPGLKEFVRNNGGIYMTSADSNGADLFCYGQFNNLLFSFSSTGTSTIGPWKFDSEALYTGVKATEGYSQPSNITIGQGGIRGYGWRLESDGGGAFAGGRISWNASGYGQIAGWSIGDEDLKMNRTYLSGCDVGAGVYIAHDTTSFEAEGHGTRWMSVFTNGGAAIADVSNMGGVIVVSGGPANGGMTFFAIPGHCSVNNAYLEVNTLILNANSPEYHYAPNTLPSFVNLDTSSWNGELPEVKDGVCIKTTIISQDAPLELKCVASNSFMQLTCGATPSSVQVAGWSDYKKMRFNAPFIIELYGYRDARGTRWMIGSFQPLYVTEAID